MELDLETRVKNAIKNLDKIIVQNEIILEREKQYLENKEYLEKRYINLYKKLKQLIIDLNQERSK